MATKKVGVKKSAKNVLDSVLKYLDKEGDTYHLKEDYVAMLKGEYVETIDEDYITTLQGMEHFGEYPTKKHISKLKFFKAVN